MNSASVDDSGGRDHAAAQGGGEDRAPRGWGGRRWAAPRAETVKPRLCKITWPL